MTKIIEVKAAFDQEKALSALLYITARTPRPDSIHILKILYFAEKDHLAKYGRLIIHDDYKKRSWGAVPTRIYDLIKAVRGNGDSHFLDTHAEFVLRVKKVLRPDGNTNDACIRPFSKPDLDVLSASDVKCLDKAIKEIGPLSLKKLEKKCHEEDEVWKITKDDNISVEIIASTLPDSEALLEYLRG